MSQQKTLTDKNSNEPNPGQRANKTWVQRQKKKCLQRVTKYYWGMANGFYCGLAGIFAKIAGSSPTGFVFYLTNWVTYFTKKNLPLARSYMDTLPIQNSHVRLRDIFQCERSAILLEKSKGDRHIIDCHFLISDESMGKHAIRNLYRASHAKNSDGNRPGLYNGWHVPIQKNLAQPQVDWRRPDQRPQKTYKR